MIRGMREHALAAIVVTAGCSPSPEFDGAFSGGETSGSTTTTTGNDGGSEDADGGPSTTGGGADSTGASDDGTKLDLGPVPDAPSPEGGCHKVDFLFVVDNSLSMDDNQANLVANVPGFLTTIEDVVEVGDFHVMVVDSDAWSIYGVGGDANGPTCLPEPECCYALCNDMAPIPVSPPPAACAGTPCDEIAEPSGCDYTLGAGRRVSADDQSCGLAGNLGYMTDQQPTLDEAFACAALVGSEGHGEERPMAAMVEALSTELAPGACNDGFLRDDALLVVTVIADSDDTHSTGDPQDWHDALVAAKGGQEEAVVVLGLFSDTGWPGALCNSDAAGERLRTLTESFTHGSWASICEPSYEEFFTEAVGVVDLGCDGFEPAG